MCSSMVSRKLDVDLSSFCFDVIRAACLLVMIATDCQKVAICVGATTIVVHKVNKERDREKDEAIFFLDMGVIAGSILLSF